MGTSCPFHTHAWYTCHPPTHTSTHTSTHTHTTTHIPPTSRRLCRIPLPDPSAGSLCRIPLQEFRTIGEKIFNTLDREGGPVDKDGGRLWPIHIRPDTGKPNGHTVSWGAMGDSFYEYTLKLWLLTGKRHEQYKRMYLESIKAMQKRLLRQEGPHTYISELKNGREVRVVGMGVCGS